MFHQIFLWMDATEDHAVSFGDAYAKMHEMIHSIFANSILVSDDENARLIFQQHVFPLKCALSESVIEVDPTRAHYGLRKVLDCCPAMRARQSQIAPYRPHYNHDGYIDWSITVPLQMVEFYFILTAVKPDLGAGMFFRLFLGTCAMLAFGYSGEAHFVNAWMGFILGCGGWAFILFEVFAGEAGKESVALGGHVKTAFDIMKFIVTIG